MTQQEWLNKAIIHKEVLMEFVSNFHPYNLSPHKDTDVMSPKITAPQAERACEVIREVIRKQSFERPDVQFNIALQKEDYYTIWTLLQDAWMGVPESTSCWQITGFKEAVDLMDDPPGEITT